MSNTPTTTDEQDARAILADYLNKLGLSSETQWAWDQITKSATAPQIEISLRERPAFQTRFAGMIEREKKGLPAISISDYLDYEAKAAQIFRSAGLPETFYDRPEDFAALIANDISPSELQDRVINGFVRVSQAPQAVRDKFAEFYGPQGDSALAAYFLDPGKAQPALERQLATAQVAGIGTRYGLNFSQDRAGDIGREKDPNDSIYNVGALETAFQQTLGTRPLFQENLGENQDLTAENEGVGAALGLDAESASLLQRRLQTRVAEGKGGGGAFTADRGFTGLGSAQHA